MRSELRLVPHTNPLGNRKEEQVIEIWYSGQLVGTVVGWDGPGVRIITKYRLEAETTNRISLTGKGALSDMVVSIVVGPR